MKDDFFNQAEYDDDNENPIEAEIELNGSSLEIHCVEEISDFLLIQNIPVEFSSDPDSLIPLVSVSLFSGAATAVDDSVVSNVMLTPSGARMVAAHLLNLADRIDGFVSLFNIDRVEGDD